MRHLAHTYANRIDGGVRPSPTRLRYGLRVSSEYSAIHEAVRLDPESVWDRVRAFLCSHDDDDMEKLDLVEDLMFWHADAFIDRLEALVADCPAVSSAVAEAYVGGLAVTAGLERFYALQDRLAPSIRG